MGDQGEVDVSPDHHQFALGEIQYAGGLVDEHEAQRHQGVHASKSDATQARLYQGVQLVWSVRGQQVTTHLIWRYNRKPYASFRDTDLIGLTGCFYIRLKV